MTIVQMTSEQYHATSAINSSRLKLFAENEYKYWAFYESPNKPAAQEPTAAMQLGTAFHTFVLEPALFWQQYGILPESCDLRTKAGKELKDAIEPKIALKHEEFKTIEAMAKSLNQHAVFKKLIENGKTEVSFFWNEESEECKVRFDIVALPCADFPNGAFCDLKTANDASPRGFGRAFYDLGYDVQTGHYAMGAMELFESDELPEVFFAAVEKSYPFMSSIYQLTESQLESSIITRNTIFERLIECKKTDSWLGYGSEFITPSWIKTDNEQIGEPKWAD